MSTEFTVDSIYKEVREKLQPLFDEVKKDDTAYNAVSHTLDVYSNMVDEENQIEGIQEIYSMIHPRNELAHFYLNATRLSSLTKNALELSTRIRGLEVGVVSIINKELRIFKAVEFAHFGEKSRITTLARKINSTKEKGSLRSGLRWEKRLVRTYLELMKKERMPGGALCKLQPEHYVESIFIEKLMSSEKRSNEPLLVGRKPLGYPAIKSSIIPIQFPLPISGSGNSITIPKKQALGHIDVLGKRGKGRRSEIEIIELKKPASKKPSVNDQIKVFRQAISYTAALQLMYKIPSFKNSFDLVSSRSRKYDPEYRATICVDDIGRANSILAMQSLNEENSHFPLSLITYNLNRDELKMEYLDDGTL